MDDREGLKEKTVTTMRQGQSCSILPAADHFRETEIEKLPVTLKDLLRSTLYLGILAFLTA